MFNKDTFFSDINVTSIYLHDLRGYQQDKVKEGKSGWVKVLQGVTWCHIKGIFSPATARRQIVLHSYVVAHQQRLCSKKRGIGKKLQLTIRVVR